MSFRGIDFGSGIAAYSDLMRKAYEDREAQQRADLQERMAVQQAHSKFGGFSDDPRVQGVPDVLSDSFLRESQDMGGRAPFGVMDVGGGELDASRDPAQNAEALRRKQIALQESMADEALARRQSQRPGEGQAPAQSLSPTDAAIREFLINNRENPQVFRPDGSLDPFVARQINELRVREQKKQGTNIYDIMDRHLDRMAMQPIREQKSPPAPPDPRIELRREQQIVNDLIKSLGAPSDSRQLTRWKKRNPQLESQYDAYMQQLEDINQRLLGAPSRAQPQSKKAAPAQGRGERPGEYITDPKTGDRVHWKEMIRRYPNMKKKIEAEAKKLGY